MEEYPRYAIYRASATYHRELMSYDLSGNRDISQRCDGLARHRIRDRTDWHGWIYREDPGLDVVRENTSKVWGRYISDPASQRLPDFVPREPRDVEFFAECVEHEEWVLTWFSHQTFDVGQSDAEVLSSFQRFLDRKGVRMSDRYGHSHYDRGDDGYCAMGADDRWRWAGALDDQGNMTTPPCRCAGCKKVGMIRINH